MTRGRPPQKGLDVAIPIAEERGLVMEFRHTAKNLCEFLIIGNGYLAMVRVRKARNLHASILQVEADFSDAINEAGIIPCGGPVSRELWLYSRFGVMRFFRIENAGLSEIDRHGLPLVTVPAGQPLITGIPQTVMNPGQPEDTPVQGFREG
jgi:hypothetical protein